MTLQIINNTDISPDTIKQAFEKVNANFAQYSSLPKRLITTAPTVIDNMDSLTGWSLVAGASLTLDDDSHLGYADSKSIKITSNSGVTSQFEKTGNWDFSDKNGYGLRLWVKSHVDPTTTLTSISVYFFKDNTTSDYKSRVFTVSTSSMKTGEWTMMWGRNLIGGTAFGDWQQGAGNLDFSSVGRIKIVCNTKAGQVSECSFDFITTGGEKKPAILLEFDDNWDSQYNLALPALQAKNMVANANVYITAIEGVFADRMTWNQIEALYAAGWDIINHSYDHDDFRAMSEADILTSLNSCKLKLQEHGLTRAIHHMSYPYGYNVDNAIAAAISGGFVTGRVAHTGGFPYALYERGTYHLNYPMSINCEGVLYESSLALAKSYIDDCIELGETCSLLFHIISESETLSYNEWGYDNFLALLDYIEEKGMQTLTRSEFYRLENSPIMVNHK